MVFVVHTDQAWHLPHAASKVSKTGANAVALLMPQHACSKPDSWVRGEHKRRHNGAGLH